MIQAWSVCSQNSENPTGTHQWNQIIFPDPIWPLSASTMVTCRKNVYFDDGPLQHVSSNSNSNGLHCWLLLATEQLKMFVWMYLVSESTDSNTKDCENFLNDDSKTTQSGWSHFSHKWRINSLKQRGASLSFFKNTRTFVQETRKFVFF